MKKNLKMKNVDTIITVVFAIALVAIYFFWKCDLDLYMTAIGGAAILGFTLLGHNQYKRIAKLSEEGDLGEDQN